jgi:hypothetical protein
VRAHVNTHSYACTHARARTHTHTHTHTHVHVHVHTQSTHARSAHAHALCTRHATTYCIEPALYNNHKRLSSCLTRNRCRSRGFLLGGVHLRVAPRLARLVASRAIETVPPIEKKDLYICPNDGRFCARVAALGGYSACCFGAEEEEAQSACAVHTQPPHDVRESSAHTIIASASASASASRGSSRVFFEAGAPSMSSSASATTTSESTSPTRV